MKYELILTCESTDFSWHEFEVDRPPLREGDIVVLKPFGMLGREYKVVSALWTYETHANRKTSVMLECELELIGDVK